MVPYIAVFLCSTLFVYLAGRCTGVLQKILFAAGFVLPCLLAGLRGVTVGTDVQVYLVWEYQAAVQTPFVAYIQQAASTAALGYNIVVWVLSNITHSLNGLMFALQLPVTGCLLCALWRHDRSSAWVGYLAFLLILFPISLNAMKQMIAASIVIFSLGFAINKRPIGFAAVVAAASLFHQTALCAVLLYPFVRLLMRARDTRAFFGKWQVLAVLVILLVGLASLFAAAPYLVQQLSGLKASYAYQANATGSRLNYSLLVLTGVCALVALFVPKASSRKAVLGVGNVEMRDFAVVSAITLVGFVVMQLDTVAIGLSRLGYYGIVFLPAMVQRAYMLEPPPRILTFACVATCAAYSYVAYVTNMGHGVFPYSFAPLGL